MERALVDFPSLQRLVLADKKAHCEGLCTLVFRADGKRTERLAPAKAGQYIALTGEFDGSRVTRAYTLASSPEETERDGVYVVTVKKAGILSGYLCDRLRVGDGISASVPYSHGLCITEPCWRIYGENTESCTQRFHKSLLGVPPKPPKSAP